MNKFTKFQMRTKSGQIVEVLYDEDGRSVCPVCGFVAAGDLPYSEVVAVDDQSAKPFAVGSQDICPCCHTQYGNDDWVDSSDETSLLKMWAALRRKWLESVTDVEQAERQLKNLEQP